MPKIVWPSLGKGSKSKIHHCGRIYKCLCPVFPPGFCGFYWTRFRFLNRACGKWKPPDAEHLNKKRTAFAHRNGLVYSTDSLGIWMSWYFASAESFTYCGFFCLGKWSQVLVSWEVDFKRTCFIRPGIRSSWRDARVSKIAGVFEAKMGPKWSSRDRKQKLLASPTKKSEFLLCH